MPVATLKPPIENAAPEQAILSKPQRLAALLVMLGPESAATILKQLPSREIEAISREMARFTLITRDQQEEILGEFSEVAVAASTSVSAGVEVTKATLEKALGSFKAGDLIGKVTPMRAAAGAMEAITDMDPRHLFNLLRDEQPQTVAFVLSHLSPERAAQVVNLLRSEQRDQVIERLATLAPTPVEVAERVVSVLNAKLGVKQIRAMAQTGGVTTAADILNAMDKAESRALLTTIEQRNPELSNAIRKKMFTFEDLLRLDTQAMQLLMRQVDTRDLTLALKKTSEPLKKLLLSSISRRAAESVQEELAMMGSVKLREVEAAQLRIIDSVRKLEAEGELDLDQVNAPKNEMV